MDAATEEARKVAAVFSATTIDCSHKTCSQTICSYFGLYMFKGSQTIELKNTSLILLTKQMQNRQKKMANKQITKSALLHLVLKIQSKKYIFC